MKKTVLMNAAKKARIALAVLAVCGFTLAGAQEAFAADPLPTTDLPVKTDANGNIICGDRAQVKDGVNGTGSSVQTAASIVIGSNATVEAGFWSVGIGALSSAVGAESVAIGGSARTLKDFSLAVGSHCLAMETGTVSVGVYSWADAKNSMALGNKAWAKNEGSVAIGYHSTTDEENTVSVGGTYEEYVGYDPVTYDPIYESKYIKRKIVNVADGTKDTDAATVGQVKSMIAAGGGASFDGTKLNTDIQNVDVAGGYKETTTNPNADTKGTIAGAINSAYQAGKDYTDTKVSVVEGKLDTLNTKVDTNTTDISNIKSDIGNIKTNIGDMTKLDVNGKNNLVDAVNEAYKAATSAGANVGDLSTLDTTNKANLVGAVNEVNKKANDAQTTADNALNKANTNATNIGNLGTLDTTNKADLVGAVNEVNKKANDAQTTADNALNKANTNATNIGNLGELNTTNKGNLVGAVNEVNDKTKQNAEAIKNVNGRVDELGDRVDTLGGAVSKLDSKVNKVGAGAAALAALHPMEFDSDNKLTFAAGVGSYHGASAAAIGAFYRPSEQVMFSIAGNMGNGENMVNAGVSFALDRPSKTPTTKAMMAKKLAEQEQMLAEQSREIAELKAMVQQLAAKQNA